MPNQDKQKGIKKYKVRLRRLRNSLGMTQRQFAEEFGVSQAIVARWELGERQPSGTAIKLLEIYERKLSAKSKS